MRHVMEDKEPRLPEESFVSQILELRAVEFARTTEREREAERPREGERQRDREREREGKKKRTEREKEGKGRGAQGMTQTW